MSGTVKKGVSSLGGQNDTPFYTPFFIGWTRFLANVSEL
ncbi:hypothetical protein C7S15_2632 [Burkholderia cepacia]|nr:hypothetical protein [Burkholderia cepacia]